MDTLFDDLRNEGMEKGIAKGRAAMLLLVLQDRQIAMTKEDETRILACQDAALLERWFRAALHARALADVFGTAHVH